MVVGWGGDTREVPEIALPLVEARVLAAGIEEQHVRCTLNQPASVEDLDPGGAHAIEGRGEVGVLGLLGLDLHGGGLVGEGADEGVAVAILGDSDRYFRLDDGVDAADLVLTSQAHSKRRGLRTSRLTSDMVQDASRG